MKIPNSYDWFAKLKLTNFIPWTFDTKIDFNSSINKQFKIESIGKREILTFGRRLDQDTFAGFEVIKGKITEKVIVFHPSFNKNVKGWDIIEDEYLNFFKFLKENVLPEMEEWIKFDDVEDYI